MEVKFYAGELEVCANCKSIWEPFDPAQLLDADMPTTSSFIEPCDNCAFRPGSVEQSDPERWAELMAQLKAGATFTCHKGVPLDPAGEHGFAYPKEQRKLRMCRGWLQMSLARLEKEWAKQPEGTDADPI